MLRKVFVLLLVGAVGVSLLWAAPERALDKQRLAYNVSARGGSGDPQINARTAPWRPVRRSLDDPIGTLYMAGSTWYDYQHNGTAGKMISADASGKVSIVWMNALDEALANRYVYYNVWDLDLWAFMYDTIGIRVDASQRGGYVSQTTMDDGFCFPGFHQVLSDLGHCASSIDYIAYIDAFTTVEPEYCYEGGSDMEIIWPKIDMDINGVLHMMASENPRNGEAGWPQRNYYSRGVPEFDLQGFGIDIHWDPMDCGGLQIWDTVMTIAPDVACSRHSDRVAVAWCQPMFEITEMQTTYTQWDNAIYLRISEDGGLNWGERIDVTQWTEPDLDCLESGGDTLMCDRDTMRAYTDCSILMDENDYIHIAFTTPAYWYWFPGEDTSGHYITPNLSRMWHWGEDAGVYSQVADGWYSVYVDCGAWQHNVQRPNLAIDPVTGYLYCSYMRYDTAYSAGGFPLSDAYVTVSTDNGVNWAVGTNVTNTMPDVIPTPAGDCLNERDITVARLVTDGILHMSYVIDRDAGGLPQEEGIATLNPVYYQRIPVDSIPTAPLMENYPMHYDSSGWVDAPVHARALPSRFVLYQNYPNPFNPTTTLQFDLASRAVVTLKVYNVVGQEVSTLLDDVPFSAGVHQVKFDGSGLASGVYIYRLLSDGHVASKKMVLMK